MASAFPIAKLGSILLSQCVNPLANYMKRRAAKNQFFRERICVPMGMFYNNHFRRTFSEVAGVSKVPPITPEQAVQLGVEIYGEFVVFFCAGSAVVYQYFRQRRKRLDREDAQAKELSCAKCHVADMETKLDAHERGQDQKIAALHAEIEELKRVLNIETTITSPIVTNSHEHVKCDCE